MKHIVLYSLVFYSTLTLGQYEKIETLQTSVVGEPTNRYVGQDNLDYLYFVKNNKLIKTKEKNQWEYQNNSLGKITQVNIENPLRILLFYETFNTVIALNNQLDEIQKINFNEYAQPLTISAIGIATQNSYWLFNQATRELLLYNYINHTYKAIGLPFSSLIKKYYSSFNYFYWIDKTNQLYRSNLYGAKEVLLTVPENDQLLYVNDEVVVYTKKDKVFVYELSKKKNFSTDIYEKSLLNCYYKNQNLIIFTAEGLTYYKLNIP